MNDVLHYVIIERKRGLYKHVYMNCFENIKLIFKVPTHSASEFQFPWSDLSKK